MISSSTGIVPETTTTPADATPTIGAPAEISTSASADVSAAQHDTAAADTSPLVASNGTSTSKLGPESVGTTITLDGFGGKVSRHDGVEVTMKELVEGSGSGIVVFTYPKASTPGCKSIKHFLFVGDVVRAVWLDGKE